MQRKPQNRQITPIKKNQTGTSTDPYSSSTTTMTTMMSTNNLNTLQQSPISPLKSQPPNKTLLRGSTPVSRRNQSKNERSESVKVAVRCRPMSSKESTDGYHSIVDVDKRYSSITLKGTDSTNSSSLSSTSTTSTSTTSSSQHKFTFDYVYEQGTNQKTIFTETAMPIVDSALQGYNGTIFAYGQTGTGKTHTMEGVVGNELLEGIMPNSFRYIYERISAMAQDTEVLVKASFLEIYLDEIYDLLHYQEKRKKMELRKDGDKGIYVKDLTSITAKCPEDLLKILIEGQKQRKVGATAMNQGSSRSHSIFTIVAETSTIDEQTGATKYRQGKLHFVDLAGSERQSKSNAEGDRMEEAKHINLSLSALGNVIKALTSPTKQHVPFRDSKLTRLLEDSLGGNTKTIMIANIGPANYNTQETLSTLRYADRAKKIQNKPRINEDPKDIQLREMQDEITLLRAKFIARQQNIDYESLTYEQRIELGSTTNTITSSLSSSSLQMFTDTCNDIKNKIQDSDEKIKNIQDIIQKTILEEQEMTNQSEAVKRDIIQRKQNAKGKLKILQNELQMNQNLLLQEEKELGELQKRVQLREMELVRGGGQVDLASHQRQELEKIGHTLELRQKERKLMEERTKTLENEYDTKNYSVLSANNEIETLQENIKRMTAKVKQMKISLEQNQQEIIEERTMLLNQITKLDDLSYYRSAILETYIPLSFYVNAEQIRTDDYQNETWIFPGHEIARDKRSLIRDREQDIKDLYDNDTTAQSQRYCGVEYSDDNEDNNNNNNSSIQYETTFLLQRKAAVMRRYTNSNPLLYDYLKSGALEDAPFVVKMLQDSTTQSSITNTNNNNNVDGISQQSQHNALYNNKIHN